MNTGGFFSTLPGRGINEEVTKKKTNKILKLNYNKDKRKRKDNELGDLFNNFRTTSHDVRSVHKSRQLAHTRVIYIVYIVYVCMYILYIVLSIIIIIIIIIINNALAVYSNNSRHNV